MIVCGNRLHLLAWDMSRLVGCVWTKDREDDWEDVEVVAEALAGMKR